MTDDQDTLAKIRSVVDHWSVSPRNPTQALLAIQAILDPPPRPIDVGDTVQWRDWAPRKVIEVRDNGTFDIAAHNSDDGINSFNVNAADCKRMTS